VNNKDRDKSHGIGSKRFRRPPLNDQARLGCCRVWSQILRWHCRFRCPAGLSTHARCTGSC